MAAELARLRVARNPWAVARGPAAAFILSAARLGWTPKDARILTTDLGRRLDLMLDPPVVVEREVHAAVRRWRWRNVASRMPGLEGNGAGHGATMEPIWRLLRKGRSAPGFERPQQAMLRSLLAGRQWPQKRLFKAQLQGSL